MPEPENTVRGHETGCRLRDAHVQGSHRRPEAHAQRDVRSDDVPEAAMLVAHYPRAVEGKNFVHNIVRN